MSAHDALRTILPLAGWSDDRVREVEITGGADPRASSPSMAPTCSKSPRRSYPISATRSSIPATASSPRASINASHPRVRLLEGGIGDGA
jgi:hypothetical protein